MMTSKSNPTGNDGEPDAVVSAKTPPLAENLTEAEAQPPVTGIELPEPDADNITVLTHKLPNKPILPWNRYDSPWEESPKEETTNEEQQSESSPEEASSNVEPSPET